MEMLCFLPDLLDAYTVTCTTNFATVLEDINGAMCPGDITQLDAVTFECLDGWYIATSAEVLGGDTQSFNINQLDPELLAAYAGLGFFILLPMWGAAYGVKLLLQTITMGK